MFSSRILATTLILSALSPAFAGDWPTWNHDNARSGVTDESLSSALREAWVYRPNHEPRPAWPAPAKQDFWHEVRGLTPEAVYDRAFHAVVLGDRLCFASSADDKVYALDPVSGRIAWTFFTGAPARLAPALCDGKAYVATDDGMVYCLNLADGALVWKDRVDPKALWLPGNGRLISGTPVRSGVLIDNGIAYLVGGLFSLQGAYVCAWNAATGEKVWKQPAPETSAQGYLLASADRLFAPMGRTTPAVFDKNTGLQLGQVKGSGGSFALLVENTLINAPGRRTGQVAVSDTDTSEEIVAFDALHMAVKDGIAYLHGMEELSALDRPRNLELARQRNVAKVRQVEIEKIMKEKLATMKFTMEEARTLNQELSTVKKTIEDSEKGMAACYKWKVACDCPYSMILAGNTLIAGGQDKLTAFDIAEGKQKWTLEVPGRVYGLSVANGRLYASTDKGEIHCFSAEPTERERVVAEIMANPYDGAEQARYADAARQILGKTGQRKGYCLVLGAGDGRLAYSIAQQSEFKVVCIESDPAKVESARRKLDAAGVYGPRVAVMEGPMDKLPFVGYFANLIVSADLLEQAAIATPASELLRVVRPYGGMICMGHPATSDSPTPLAALPDVQAWATAAASPPPGDWVFADDAGTWAMFTRGEVPGAGEWNQLYADSAHTACSGDKLEGPMEILWFGEPGPRDMIDRHHRPMSSLVREGRVFIPGNDKVIAADLYNGTQLWTLEVPNSRRVGALRNCGHMVLTPDALHVAVQDELWLLDPSSGAVKSTMKSLQPLQGETYDWGYLDISGDAIIGSGQKPGASLAKLDRTTVTDLIEGDFRPVIMSNYLFCLEKATGLPRWTYQSGCIVNNAIAVSDGKLLFVESRNPEAVNDDDGRIRADVFCAKDTFFIALDLASGAKVYEQPVKLPFQHIMFLNCGGGLALVTGTSNAADKVKYDIYAFDTATGAEKWHSDYIPGDGIDGTHGEQWQHPLIIGDKVVSRPFAFDLQTGQKLDYMAKRGGGGCGGLTSCESYLFGRGTNPRMYPLNTTFTEGERLTAQTRPGCWLNIIPAGGVVVIPESSSGCTCGFAMQTSLALAPSSIMRP